jgi:hypothetical protein
VSGRVEVPFAGVAYVTPPMGKHPRASCSLSAVGLDRDLTGRIRRLDEYDLRRLLMFANGLLHSRTGERAGAQAVGTTRPSYRQQWVRCGKKTCTRCPHGPYWYAYWREEGRVRSGYLGKQPPAEVEPSPPEG